MDKLNVLIAGATGYIGTQLVKLLCKHKNVKIKYLCGNTSVGKNISFYDKDLNKYKLPKIIKINYNLFKDVDVIFTSLPNGESQKIANKLVGRAFGSGRRHGVGHDRAKRKFSGPDGSCRPRSRP